MGTFDQEVLSAIAELGLGLAGFSGIGLVLTRTTGRLLPYELYRLGIMLGTSLGAMILSLVPLVLAQLGLSDEALCRVSSGIMAAYLLGFNVYYTIAMRHFRRNVPEIVSRTLAPIVALMHGVNLLLQLATTLGVLRHCVGFYSLGLMLLLIHATYQFGRILFIRPHLDEGP